MDDFDEERFARGPRPLDPLPARGHRLAGGEPGQEEATGPPRRVIRRDDDREDLLCGEIGLPAVIRVTALSEAGRREVHQELQLLAALEVAGIAAAPTVLEIEDDGYVREDAQPLQGRSGRRSAGQASPATGERRAQARAREALDALIDELHDRGWVLGAPSGHGLGIRADGTVTVLDLSGLRQEGSTTARLDDRLWVDSVLRDEGRTLRRRIDRCRPQAVSSAPTVPPPGLGWESGSQGEPGTDWVHGPDEAEDVTGSAKAGALDEPAGDEHDDRDDRDGGVDRDDPAEEELATMRPVPAPRAAGRRRGRRSRPPWPSLTGRGILGALLAVPVLVREVLSAPGARRVALLSAVAVIFAGAALGSGMWWVVPEHPPAARTASGTQPPGPGSSEQGQGPRITDPLSLATDLAHARHDYVTGAGTAAVAVPGSPAEASDDQVRRAYQGATVEGGEPEVHAARVLESPTPQGTAQLAVTTTAQAHTVIEADGSRTRVPASPAETVRLDLGWHDGRWHVVDVRPD